MKTDKHIFLDITDREWKTLKAKALEEGKSLKRLISEILKEIARGLK